MYSDVPLLCTCHETGFVHRGRDKGIIRLTSYRNIILGMDIQTPKISSAYLEMYSRGPYTCDVSRKTDQGVCGLIVSSYNKSLAHRIRVPFLSLNSPSTGSNSFPIQLGGGERDSLFTQPHLHLAAPRSPFLPRRLWLAAVPEIVSCAEHQK